jgi:microcystin-dependent protein
MFGGLRPPEGWLLCDGTAVSRSTYGRLFSVIGTAYGPGDGSTTFGLPDLRGRIPAGLDGTQEEFNSLGKKGGEKAHTLTMEEIPSHQHSVYPHAGFLGGGKEGAGGADPGTRVHDSITGPAGGGTAHNNLQPYQTIQFIIRY